MGYKKTIASMVIALSMPIFLTIGNMSYADNLDTGGSWQEVTDSPTIEYLEDVFFIDKNTGWIVGKNGLLLATKDGGKSWIKKEIGIQEWIQQVEFVNQNTGWILTINNEGLNDNLYRTDDGGDTWEKQQSGIDATAMDFVDEHYGWFTGRDHTIFATNDGGYTWQAQQSTEANYSFYMGADIEFIDHEHGWIAAWLGIDTGGSASKYGILSTADGGTNWSRDEINIGYLTEVDFISIDEGWIAGYSWQPSVDECQSITYIYKTNNGGQDISKLNTICGYPSDMQFTSSTHGWLLDSTRLENYEQNIKSTVDGGITWEKKYIGTKRLSALHMIDNTEGWAVGEQGTIIHYTASSNDDEEDSSEPEIGNENCHVATLNSNLSKLHIPNLKYEAAFGTLYFWLVLEALTVENEIVFEIKDFGLNNRDIAVNCDSPVLKTDLSFKLSHLQYKTEFGIIDLWVEFKFLQTLDDRILFQVTDFGGLSE